MKNRKRTLALFIVLAMVLSIVLTTPFSAAPEGAKLVWSPDLTGATTPGSGRHYVSNADKQTVGLILSSSDASPTALGSDGNALKFVSGGSSRRLNVIVKGTGSGGSSLAGFAPEDGKTYYIEVVGENATRTGPADIAFWYNDTTTAATVVGNTFSHTFSYDEDFYNTNPPPGASMKDGTHGNVAIGIVVVGVAGTTAFLSNIKIYELAPCEVCKENVCVCVYCPSCHLLMEECSCCDTCGSSTCNGCTANTIYNMQNDPSLPALADPERVGNLPDSTSNNLGSNSGNGVVVTDNPLTIIAAGRTGTSQGVAFRVAPYTYSLEGDNVQNAPSFELKAGHSYEFIASGTLGTVAGTGVRLISQGGSDVKTGTTTAGGAFTLSYKVDYAGIGSNTWYRVGSLGSGTNAFNFTYTDMRIVAYCPTESCAGCTETYQSGHTCEDKCVCDVCECDCVNKDCHDCGTCEICLPPVKDTYKVNLAAQDGQNWANHTGKVVEVNGNGTYKAEISFPGGVSNLVDFKLVSTDEDPVPESFANTEVTFGDITVNTTVVSVDRGAHTHFAVPADWTGVTNNGMVDISFWNAWYQAGCTLVGGYTVEVGDFGGFSIGHELITTITVEFTISGIGETPSKINPNAVYLGARTTAGGWPAPVFGEAVDISENGTHTVTINLPAGYPNLIQLGVLSEGSTFEGTSYEGLTPTPSSWSDREIVLDSITFNTSITSVGVETDKQISPLVEEGWEAEGFVAKSLWNAWGDMILTGITPIDLPSGTSTIPGFAVPGASTLSTIEVVFTVRTAVHTCEDKCVCEICECDCVNKDCHDCGTCIICVEPHSCDEHVCTLCGRTCEEHICTLCGRICEEHICTICERICEDECSCEICECDCVNKDCHDCGTCEDCKPIPDFNVGDIDGNGLIGMQDALEILKYLAGLSNNLLSINGNDSAEWYASLITASSKAIGVPTILDAMEILKFLAELPSVFSS